MGISSTVGLDLVQASAAALFMASIGFQPVSGLGGGNTLENIRSGRTA
jgi:hypothetical protein